MEKKRINRNKILVQIIIALIAGIACSIIAYNLSRDHEFTNAEIETMKEKAIQMQKSHKEFGAEAMQVEQYYVKMISEDKVSVEEKPNGRIEFNLRNNTEELIPLKNKVLAAVLTFPWGMLLTFFIVGFLKEIRKPSELKLVSKQT